MKAYITEATGTLALALIVALSLGGPIGVVTPLLAALVLGLFVYTTGHISGSHLNPAITIGAWSVRKISTKQAVGYIVSQFVGAGVVLLLMKNGFANAADLSVSGNWHVLAAETLGTFFFAFGIASVLFNKTPETVSGIVIGGSLLFGIMIAAFAGSNGMLNPAVALSAGSFGLMYIIGPIIGSIAGMQAYRALKA